MSARAQPIAIVGPLPPKLHGQAIATDRLAACLRAAGLDLEVVRLSEDGWMQKVKTHFAALRSIYGLKRVYLSLNSNTGMWLTGAIALATRSWGGELFIHHHSFRHVDHTSIAMSFTSWAAGPAATHIVLSNNMALRLRAKYSSIVKTLVLNNAGFVTEHGGTRRKFERPITLAHLSNLTEEKGVARVVDAAIAAREKGYDIQLVLAGPCSDAAASASVIRGKEALGERFTYLGSVTGAAKAAFYRTADIFLFPSSYKNEASPIVLYEALANGVPAVASAAGCIPEILGRGGGVCCRNLVDFATVTIAFLDEYVGHEPRYALKALQRFNTLTREYNHQLRIFVERISPGRRYKGLNAIHKTTRIN